MAEVFDDLRAMGGSHAGEVHLTIGETLPGIDVGATGFNIVSADLLGKHR